jgi:hypothetical protein
MSAAASLRSLRSRRQRIRDRLTSVPLMRKCILNNPRFRGANLCQIGLIGTPVLKSFILASP